MITGLLRPRCRLERPTRWGLTCRPRGKESRFWRCLLISRLVKGGARRGGLTLIEWFAGLLEDRILGVFDPVTGLAFVGVDF
jgi:hypothetical protein